jgi:hypothetical protein
MPTRLGLYNGALMECGERELLTLSENREPRRLLDRAWDNGLIDYVLGQGQWKFAKLTVELAASTSIEPDFGYRNAYEYPSDHIRTCGVSADEYMNTPLTQYTSERNVWFTEAEPLYVSYVSNDSSYGGDLSLWPGDFCLYVEAYLAHRIVRKLTQDKEDWGRLFKLTKVRLKDAKSSDAMEGPTVFPPTGAWVSARAGRGSPRDRGNRGSLIG